MYDAVSLGEKGRRSGANSGRQEGKCAVFGLRSVFGISYARMLRRLRVRKAHLFLLSLACVCWGFGQENGGMVDWVSVGLNRDWNAQFGGRKNRALAPAGNTLLAYSLTRE